MSDTVLDLDILKPKAQIVKLANKKIDISFVPVGITFELDALIRELAPVTEEELSAEDGAGEKSKMAVGIAVKICSLFCAVKNPEMTEVWFQSETTPGQIMALCDVIKNTLASSYEGVEEYASSQ